MMSIPFCSRLAISSRLLSGCVGDSQVPTDTRLLWAAQLGDTAAVEVLTTTDGDGADINARNSQGASALVLAAEAGHAEALKKALELSPSLRRLYEDAVRAQDLLSVVRKRRREAAAAAPARRSGGPMKEIFKTWMADINKTLQAKGIHIDLVAVGVEITSEASDAIDARL